jgi:hypothetical protein
LAAGVFTWAAESVYRLNGNDARFSEYCNRAAAVDPYSERLPFLLTHDELQDTRTQLKNTRAALHAAEERIREMESSKFWKLRGYVTRVVPERLRALSWRRSAA